MRLYPDLAGPRNRQITRDMFVLLSLALFAFFAWAVKKAVMTLTAISAGFTDNAQGVEDSWDSIGSSLSGIPFVGDDIQGALSGLSDATVGNAVEAGQAITEAVTTTANVLAFVTFAAPAAVLLVLYLPRRLDRSRAWTAADTVLSAIEVNPAFGLAGRRRGSVPGVGPDPGDRGAAARHDRPALGPARRGSGRRHGRGPRDRPGRRRVPARRAAGPARPVRPAVRRPRALHAAAVRGVLCRGLRPVDPRALRP